MHGQHKETDRYRHHGEAGGTPTPEYTAWQLMKGRCLNPNHPDFHHYGGRGITVFPLWKHSYKSFLACVGRKPSPKHSLDRFPDINGNYEPGNVRWATQTQQTRNTRVNHLITIDGVTRCIAEWAEVSGISGGTIIRRIKYGFVGAALIGPLVAQTARRRRRGDAHPKAKLTNEIVRAMRADYAAGVSRTALIGKYNVARTTVANVVTGKMWTHVL